MLIVWNNNYYISNSSEYMSNFITKSSVCSQNSTKLHSYFYGSQDTIFNRTLWRMFLLVNYVFVRKSFNHYP